MQTPQNTPIPASLDRLRTALAGVELRPADAQALDQLAALDSSTADRLADLLTRARAAGPAPSSLDTGTSADHGESRPCATCPRVWSPLVRRSHRWIVRRDGLGLMCPTCLDRMRRGVATDRPVVTA